MNLLASSGSRGCLALASIVLAALTSSLRAVDPAPVIAKPAVNAAVTVKDDGTMFTLENGIVTAPINKRNGDLESPIYKGIDPMGHGQGRAGYWEQDLSAAAKVGGLTQSITIDPAKNGGTSAEVSIQGVTKGDLTAGLTPGAPASGTVNCDLEVRCALPDATNRPICT